MSSSDTKQVSIQNNCLALTRFHESMHVTRVVMKCIHVSVHGTSRALWPHLCINAQPVASNPEKCPENFTQTHSLIYSSPWSFNLSICMYGWYIWTRIVAKPEGILNENCFKPVGKALKVNIDDRKSGFALNVYRKIGKGIRKLRSIWSRENISLHLKSLTEKGSGCRRRTQSLCKNH